MKRRLLYEQKLGVRFADFPVGDALLSLLWWGCQNRYQGDLSALVVTIGPKKQWA
jgi:hypothetical protein